MATYKSLRNYFEYPLLSSDKEKIQSIIKHEFDKYLHHNMQALNASEYEHLRRMAVDQLSEFMTELSDEKTRWSLDSNVITIRIQSRGKKLSRRTIENLSREKRDCYRFIQKSNKWECHYCTKTRDGISYDEFKQEVYSQMFSATSTAAFYAIDSWFVKI